MATKLRDLIQTKTENTGGFLQELKIKNDEAELLKFFTEEGDDVGLHYTDDPAFRGYFQCLGADCPMCKIGKKPVKHYLLPVYSVSQNSVAVLRLSKDLGARKLLPQILALLDDPELDEKLIEIKRLNAFDYEARPINGNRAKMVGVEVIAAFVKCATDVGDMLLKVYPKYTSESIAEIPSVKKQLEIRGFLAEEE